MAMRRSRSRTRKEETEPTDGEEEVTEESQEGSKLTKKAKRGYFEKYEAADKALDAAKDKMAEANKKRSDVAREIYEKMGKGPFRYNGVTISITRKGKSDDEATFFFRKQSEDGVEEI